MILDRVNSPSDVKMLNKDELNTLADEITKVIVDNFISVDYRVKSKNGIIFRKLSK